MPPSRGGQALVETALGLVIFMLVLGLVLDVAWLYYHQISLTRGVQATARRASTNAYDEAAIRAQFFREVHHTQAAAGDPDRTRLEIELRPLDPVYASTYLPFGTPSVQVRVAHDHRPLLGLGRSLGVTLTAESRAPLEVAPGAPRALFPPRPKTP